MIPSAPPVGKTDIFDGWFTGLVVVSLGTSQDGRDLSLDEIAGALFGQVERLVIDRDRREHQAPRPAPSESVRVTQLTPVVTDLHPSTDVTPRDNVTDISALLEGIKKSQPLVPAGPSKNGIHEEPDSAS